MLKFHFSPATGPFSDFTEPGKHQTGLGGRGKVTVREGENMGRTQGYRLLWSAFLFKDSP